MHLEQDLEEIYGYPFVLHAELFPAGTKIPVAEHLKTKQVAPLEKHRKVGPAAGASSSAPSRAAGAHAPVRGQGKQRTQQPRKGKKK